MLRQRIPPIVHKCFWRAASTHMPCIRRASFKEVTTSGCIDVDDDVGEVYRLLVASLPDRNIHDFLFRSMSAAHPVLTVKAEANRSQSESCAFDNGAFRFEV